MIFNFKTIRLFIAVLLLLFAAEARADGPKKICVLPFEVYALSGSAELQASVYNSLPTEFGREKKVEVKTAGGFEPGSHAPTRRKRPRREKRWAPITSSPAALCSSAKP